MLTRIYIDNFKSLIGFHLPPKDDPLSTLPKRITLVGVNGAGKTTLLQALSFLRQLMLGRVSDWLQQRDWRPSDLAWRGNKTIHPEHKARLTFSLELQHDLGTLRWSGQLDYKTLKCVNEQLSRNEQPVLIPNLVEDLPPLPLSTFEALFTDVKYEGSIFSLISTSDAPAADAINQFLTRTISLELLSPHAMRRRARPSDELGTTGEKLSGFISQRSAQQRADILQDLRRFYPHVRGLSTRAIQAGWQELFVHEANTKTVARHLNDGMLRVLAIIAQVRSDAPCILLEEVENGISTETVEQLVQYLLDAPQQLLLTTHSVLFVNYMPDEEAARSLFLLYKTPEGVTRAARFFSIPRLHDKLTAMSPGEALADTDLHRLTRELCAPQDATP